MYVEMYAEESPYYSCYSVSRQRKAPPVPGGLAADYGRFGVATSVIQTDVTGRALRCRLAHFT